MKNSLMIINPYKHNGTWVFDDEVTGLVKEPFVSGIPEMIDELTKEIENPEKGFRLIFSETPFPGYRIKLIKTDEEYGGAWYKWEEMNMTGWLCPALFRYFKKAPETIYAGL